MRRLGIEFSPCEERQEDRSSGSQKANPFLIGAEEIGITKPSKYRSSDYSHTDFDQCDGDANMVSDQSRNDGEREPEGARVNSCSIGSPPCEPCKVSVLTQTNRLQRLSPRT